MPPFSKYIDHTLLDPGTVPAQIDLLCQEAVLYDFAAVCVNPRFVSQARALLQEADITVCSVAGFPLGASTTNSKVEEAKQACGQGAAEIDMVIWIGGLKCSNFSGVESEIRQVVNACEDYNADVKVILETALLSDSEKREGALAALNGGAKFVKTSTGFGPGGATCEDVRLLADIVKNAGMRVKASGGIRDFKTAAAMVACGADRIGTSSGVKIMLELANLKERTDE